MSQFACYFFFALVFAVVFPLGFFPAREGPAAAGTGPSMISTSSSEFVNFLFEVRLVDEAGSIAVLIVVIGAAEEGASTSITVGSPELEFDNRGRGGGCKGLDRAEEGAIDGFVDLVLCERTEEVGDGLREWDADRRSVVRRNKGSSPNSSTSSALLALPPTTISSSNSVRVSLQSRLNTLSADKPSSNERILASIRGSSPTAEEITPSPLARALNRSREREAEFRIEYLTRASPSSSFSCLASGMG